MAESLVAAADRAFVEEDYDKAVQGYTDAIQVQPDKAEIWEARASAHIKLQNWLDAAGDASKAIELSPSLSKAYLRKGIACFHLEEYESAKESFEAGAKLAPDAAQFKTWIRKCQAELDDEADPAASTPVGARPSHSPASMPAPSAPTPPPAPAAAATQPLSHPAPAPCPPQASTSNQAPASGSGTDPAQGSSGAAGQPLARAAVPGFEGKYRHQWYQLQSKVTVDVYAKGLSKEQAEVTFEEQRLLVVLKDASGEEEYRLDMPLYGKIQPGACHYEVLKSKLEITMSKADSTQWASLEKSSRVAAPNYSNPATPPVAGQYPSSYVKAPKDWNKVEAEVKDLENKGELDDGDPLNSFFKKIFSQGDEDQRRAMMKSFVESNGTVLSTNWKEVGAKKIETQPPDGMAVKKWEA
ncbi:SGS domain-containing protein [Haematococcus lacustris]